MEELTKRQTGSRISSCANSGKVAILLTMCTDAQSCAVMLKSVPS